VGKVRRERVDDDVVFYGLNNKIRVKVSDMTITKQHPLFLPGPCARELDQVV